MINCNKEVMKRIKSAKPGDPSVLVSLEALESLPEIYSATIVSIPFSVPNGKESNEDWSVVATYPNVMYMPTVNLLSTKCRTYHLTHFSYYQQNNERTTLTWYKKTKEKYKNHIDEEE